jgi:hypothetical protein
MPFEKYYIYGSESYTCVVDWLFQGFFLSIFRFWYNAHEIHRKKLGVLKKNFMKKPGPKRISWRNFWIFFQKKNRIFFSKFFFKSCSFDAKTSAKKNFFLEKITITTHVSLGILSNRGSAADLPRICRGSAADLPRIRRGSAADLPRIRRGSAQIHSFSVT